MVQPPQLTPKAVVVAVATLVVAAEIAPKMMAVVEVAPTMREAARAILVVLTQAMVL